MSQLWKVRTTDQRYPEGFYPGWIRDWNWTTTYSWWGALERWNNPEGVGTSEGAGGTSLSCHTPSSLQILHYALWWNLNTRFMELWLGGHSELPFAVPWGHHYLLNSVLSHLPSFLGPPPTSPSLLPFCPHIIPLCNWLTSNSNSQSSFLNSSEIAHNFSAIGIHTLSFSY